LENPPITPAIPTLTPEATFVNPTESPAEKRA